MHAAVCIALDAVSFHSTLDAPIRLQDPSGRKEPKASVRHCPKAQDDTVVEQKIPSYKPSRRYHAIKLYVCTDQHLSLHR